MNIQPIVEGHGEVDAVPVLLRRLLSEAKAYQISVNPPIRKPQSQLLRKDCLENAVALARIQDSCCGILILFEAEDECPARLGPRILEWATGAAGGVPVVVAMPHREYEAWFLASIESLRGRRRIRIDAASHAEPESVRDAKGKLEERMEQGARYFPTVDQAALSQIFDMKAAYAASRSFQHLVASIGRLLQQNRVPLDHWPPLSWVTGKDGQ